MIKIFENDAYIKKFKTKIMNINEENKAIELAETAFYAKGGGQPGDIGWIEKNGKIIKINETYKIEQKIIHKAENIDNLKIGDEIVGKLDWKIRYRHMKMHSALHLLCAVIPLGVTGGQIGYQKSRLDFNAQEQKINKEEIEKKINKLVLENHKIEFEWISKEELNKKPDLVRTMSVKPPGTNGKIRLVKIGDIDLQPCGGTHVKSTIEIGKISIGKIENKGKMNRRVNILLTDEESD
tara:strand:- start:29 stop:742 length:714 start_codon:yes stop_codon:yes gene_type:complete